MVTILEKRFRIASISSLETVDSPFPSFSFQMRTCVKIKTTEWISFWKSVYLNFSTILSVQLIMKRLMCLFDFGTIGIVLLSGKIIIGPKLSGSAFRPPQTGSILCLAPAQSPALSPETVPRLLRRRASPDTIFYNR